MSEDLAFPATQHLVNSILYLAINDTRFLKLVRGLLEPDLLPGDTAKQLLRVTYRYYDKSPKRLAPGKYFADELNAAFRTGLARKSEEDGIKKYVEMLGGFSSVDRDYVVRKINEFVRTRKFSLAVVEAGLRCRRYDLAGTEQVLTEALKFGVTQCNVGSYFLEEENYGKRARTYQERPDFLMPFGIEPFDKAGAYLQRKFFILIMAQEKRGKTWAGVHFGKIALLQGLKVLHVTHESGITEERLAERYEMNIAAVGSNYKKDGWSGKTPILRHTRLGKFKLDTEEISPGTVRDRGKVEKALNAVKEWGGVLLIKEFARGTCSMAELESYIDGLEVTEEFVPDVIINDYPDIMRLSGGEYRHAINEVYEAHSAMSSQRNCLVIGFSQVKASAYGKKIVRMSDFAEDKRKAAHCEAAFAICQTSKEEEQGRVRFVWVLDGRQGMERKQAGLLQDYHIGQFCKKAYSLGDIESGEEEEKDAGS